MRAGIDSGHLAAGTQLPPSRLLAEQLGVSRKTVAEAYSRLTYDNLLSGVVGRGTFVTPRQPLRSSESTAIPLAAAASLERWQQRATVLSRRQLEAPSRYDFIGGASSKAQFPFDQWRSCLNYALRRSQRHPERQFPAQGLPELREAIAHHVAYARGVHCSAADLLVCNGAQQALDLIARVLVEPGCQVAMEDPGYPPARQLFLALGARLQSVPVDDEGLCVEQIADGTRADLCDALAPVPAGHADERATPARPAGTGRRAGCVDHRRRLRLRVPLPRPQPPDALQRLDRHGLVAYVGTFFQDLAARVAPGLRRTAARRAEGRLRGQAPQRLAQPDPVAVGTGALSRRRPPEQAHPPLPRGLQRPSRTHPRTAGRRPGTVVQRHPRQRRVPPQRPGQTWGRCRAAGQPRTQGGGRPVFAGAVLQRSASAPGAVAGLRRHRAAGHRPGAGPGARHPAAPQLTGAALPATTGRAIAAA
ncbi:GntR family transcriptional regulator [Pseudomonas putida S11]|nr:GntR family transcriptional regulator [Pseudomonas putida S11]